DAGGERQVVVAAGQGRVDGDVGLVEGRALAPGVAGGADGQAGQHGGVDAVPHAVDDREVDDAVVDGVVEDVAGDVVGGLEDPGGQGPGNPDRPRRQQV